MTRIGISTFRPSVVTTTDIPASKKEAETPVEVKKDIPLSEILKDKNVAMSFDCMEGIPAEKPKTAMDFVRNKLPIIGSAVASAAHLFAGLGSMTDLIPKPVTEFLDTYALKFSKTVNVLNYAYKGVEALIKKRAWEGLSRLAYTAIVPWVPLESVFTYSGVSSGFTMFEQAQRHKIKYPNGKPESIFEDLKENGKAFISMCKEVFTPSSLWGKDRKVFVHYKNENDKGHTMFFSAWGNFVGALLGMLTGSNHSSALGKTAAIVRNGGGIGCDWAKFFHPDWNNKLSAIFYAFVSAFDVVKSFTKPETSHTLSHFSMAVNNFANYYYVNTTKDTSDGKFVDYKVAA